MVAIAISIHPNPSQLRKNVSNMYLKGFDLKPKQSQNRYREPRKLARSSGLQRREKQELELRNLARLPGLQHSLEKQN